MHKISNLKYIYILFYDDYRRWDYLICFTCYYNMNMKIQKDKTIIIVIFSVVHFFPPAGPSIGLVSSVAKQAMAGNALKESRDV